MSAGEIVGIAVGATVLIAFVGRLLWSAHKILGVGEKALDRLLAVEHELKPNSGESLRDQVDHANARLQQVHVLAADNNDKHTRMEQRLDEHARLTADAARLAAKNDDEIRHIREETRRRHQENLDRFRALERNDEDQKILRELLLMSLRENHGIDLLPDEDGLGDEHG